MLPYNEMKSDAAYFVPGDKVQLKQELPNQPIMIVKSIDKTALQDVNEKPKLIGVTCQWFNTKQELQTARFSTKDLVKYDNR